MSARRHDRMWIKNGARVRFSCGFGTKYNSTYTVKSLPLSELHNIFILKVWTWSSTVLQAFKLINFLFWSHLGRYHYPNLSLSTSCIVLFSINLCNKLAFFLSPIHSKFDGTSRITPSTITPQSTNKCWVGSCGSYFPSGLVCLQVFFRLLQIKLQLPKNMLTWPLWN